MFVSSGKGSFKGHHAPLIKAENLSCHQQTGSRRTSGLRNKRGYKNDLALVRRSSPAPRGDIKGEIFALMPTLLTL